MVNYDLIRSFYPFAFAGIVIGLLLALGAWGDQVSCNAKWADSGRKHEWSFFAGCRVEDSEGKMIPEANVRDIK